MKKLLIISIFFTCSIFAQTVETSMLYINEQGQVKLTKVNDSLWKVAFETLDEYSYDTTLIVSNKQDAIRVKPSDEIFFLEYNWGGLSVSESKVEILEFSSFGRLAYESGMSQIYTLPFVRTDKEISYYGDLEYSKGHAIMDGIFFDPNLNKDKDGKFYKVKGTVVREPFPRSFYSTPDSPQGMFSDTSKTYYRLLFKDYEIEEPEYQTYTGTAINNSKGQACIAWEFADSEAFILEGRDKWKSEEIGKQVKVKGYLWQGNKGSILKNWEVIQ
jgi:hypothetical protein